MTQPTLFPLPPPVKVKRQPRPDNQVTRCKKCWGSNMCNGVNMAYCYRLSLRLYYEDGLAKLTKDDHPIRCDGKDWRYMTHEEDDNDSH